MKMQGKRPAEPRARRAELVTERFDDGLVVYDQRSDAAHSLRPDVAAVWRLCDGSATPQQIASRLALDPELVECALFQLEVCDLLEPAESAESEGFDFARIDRRDMLKRTAAISGGVALISSVLVPASAFAFGSNNVMLTVTGKVTSSPSGADSSSVLTATSSQTSGMSPADNSGSVSYPGSGTNKLYCDTVGNVTTNPPASNYIGFEYGNSSGQPIAVVDNYLTSTVPLTVTIKQNGATTTNAASVTQNHQAIYNVTPGATLNITIV